MKEHDRGNTSPQKTIAVVMATYNGAVYLEAQLNSILSQTRMPDKLLICDDRSTDQTINIIERYRLQHPFISYVVNEKQLGVVCNFRKAVSLTADVDYIALSDQDDEWVPTKLETLYQAMQEVEDPLVPVIIYSDLMLTDSDGRIRNKSFWHELGQDGFRHCFETLVFGNFVTGCTVLMNQEMRTHFIRMPGSALMHDAWLGLVAFSVGRAARIEAPLVKYRSHDNNVVFSSGAYKRKNKVQRIADHVKLLFTRNDYLVKQLELISLFEQAYQAVLSGEQNRQVSRFLALKNRSYLRKLLLFRLVFRKHWL
jgi:glycosyltransferase involved in cell wall biosynthesis